MYFRRFPLSEIPLEDGDDKAFDQWIRDRWTEKDELMEEYMCTGRFPGIVDASGMAVDGMSKDEVTGGYFIETEMKPKHWWEVIGVGAGLGWLLLGITALVEFLQGGSSTNVVEETTALLSRPDGAVRVVTEEL